MPFHYMGISIVVVQQTSRLFVKWAGDLHALLPPFSRVFQAAQAICRHMWRKLKNGSPFKDFIVLAHNDNE